MGDRELATVSTVEAEVDEPVLDEVTRSEMQDSLTRVWKT